MKEKVIAVFDIGKTNKKLLLFNVQLKVVFQHEEKISTVRDEDGDECDDILRIENWIKRTISDLLSSDAFDVAAVNFSTYGASLAFLDDAGNRLTPIYNYLKEIPGEIREKLFSSYGGKEEFCRKTASPDLGMLLNSGIQVLWLQERHPQVFNKTASILHFPQYLSFLFTGNVVSESTSIGCHTFMWDFDENRYHDWIGNEGIQLPDPVQNKHTVSINIEGRGLHAGIGIHDSSASLVPYILGSKKHFMLISTGTWCINMNPFNHSPLTRDQLEKDCLAYMSIDQTPVKSSRLFMGHIHDENAKWIAAFFNVPEDFYKQVKIDEQLLAGYLSAGRELVFFREGMPGNYVDEQIDLSAFSSFKEAYHRLMYDLTILNSRSMELISDARDGVMSIYVSGGFARNEIFVRLLASFYPERSVYTSEVDNATALGAALVVWDVLDEGPLPEIDLGLVQWKPVKG